MAAGKKGAAKAPSGEPASAPEKRNHEAPIQRAPVESYVSSVTDHPHRNADPFEQIALLREQDNIPVDSSANITDGNPGRSAWRYERKNRPKKTGRSSRLLRGVLEGPDSRKWKEKAANMRGRQLQLVLLQILIRKEAMWREESHDLLALLPTDEIWASTLQKTAAAAACTVEDLENWASVLEGANDDEKCAKFLEQPKAVPLFALSHLLRYTAKFQDIATLSRFIDVFHTASRDDKDAQAVADSKGPAGPSLTVQNIDPNEYSIFVSMLAHHCLRLEPRLLVNLANAVAFYIETLPCQKHASAAFHERCKLFNDSLVLFRPQSRLHVEQTAIPNPYFWEAQRILLSMSDGLERPLLVDGRGFRAIRDVLAGMPKSGAEVHNSLRHAPTWPPYLRPGDGIDERSDPEDNWGRVVGAGMLMQEAGYGKHEWDEALDIMQGMAPDGTPTIQQRFASGDWRRAGAWEASIRATRNAQEAWNRFLTPPTDGAVPGVDEYAAMFEKLVLREASGESGLLPGDKAVNFPVHRQANLADIEWARQRPPSVSQLYERMRHDGLHPTGHCLHILVANAESVDLANRYLSDSAVRNAAYRSLITDQDPTAMKEIDMGLISAYVHVLLRADGKRAWRHFRRAMRVAAARVDSRQSRWVPLVWGPILKQLSQHHYGLRISLAEQVTLISQVAERIEKGFGMTLPTFNQLNKCTRKIISRELRPALDPLRSESQQTDAHANSSEPAAVDGAQGKDGSLENKAASEQTSLPRPAAALFRGLAELLKQNFQKLIRQEKTLSQSIRPSDITPLDYMMTRRDPVRSEHALEYMTALAFAGDYNEMSSVLRWLIDQWGRADAIAAIETLDEPPPYAEFFEVLCVFRLFAEPRLDPGEVAALQMSIQTKGLTWTWPDDNALETYLQVQDNESLLRLRSALARMQPQRRD